MQRLAVILTHNRPELLVETWAAIGPQVDVVIIIDNASSPPVDVKSVTSEQWPTLVMSYPDQPPNLSRMWNFGIAMAQAVRRDWSDDRRRIAVLCDDAPPPPGWFDVVTEAMDATGAVVGCSAPEGFGWIGAPVVKTGPDSDIMRRMPGWAWILDPSRPVRADERFEWWWGDTDLDWQARAAGGMVIIGSHPVPNRRPNDFTARPEQSAQAGADSARFVAKHGWRPW